MILADGDVLKHDAILWGVSLEAAKPYLKHRQRQIIFRECVIGALTSGQGSSKTPTDHYCEECRKTGLADCATCDRKIEVVNG